MHIENLLIIQTLYEACIQSRLLSPLWCDDEWHFLLWQGMRQG
jgi:hypothetical protein